MTTHTAEQPRPGDRVEITAVQSYETTWDDSLDWLIGVTGVLVTVDETGVYENTVSGRLDCAPYRVRVDDTADCDAGALVSAAGVRRLDTADGPAGAAPGEAREPAATDTLPAWLRQRFTASGVDWENLDDAERSYWEHQARAVRRAVARGGFKTAATVPVVSSAADGNGQ